MERLKEMIPEKLKKLNLKSVAEKAKKNRSTIVSLAMAVAICVLFLIVIVLGTSLGTSKAKINRTHALLQSRTLYTISSARNLADGIHKPGADVPGVILPDLECALSTLEELNNLLIELYGSDAAIVDSSLMTKIDAALYDLQKCYTTGKPSETSLATLSGYLSELVNVLNYYS